MSSEQFDKCELRRLRQEETEIHAMLATHISHEECVADKCGCLQAPACILVKTLLEEHPFLWNKDNDKAVTPEWLHSLSPLARDQLAWHMRVFRPRGLKWTRGRARKLLEALGEMASPS